MPARSGLPGTTEIPQAARDLPVATPLDGAALRAAGRREHQVADGSWLDASLGTVTFRDYVEQVWLPSRHIEASTFAAYRSNLDRHFLPAFGHRPMAQILPLDHSGLGHVRYRRRPLSPTTSASTTRCCASIFKRAVRDRIIVFNPCDDTELPKVIARRSRTLTPDEYDAAAVAAIPDRHRLMVETAIETGMRWGELIALRPRHIDFLRRSITVRGDDRRGLQEALPHRRTL